MTQATTSNTRSRAVLLGILAIFMTPVLIAVFLNSRMSDFAPEATRNYGTLVQPVVELPEALKSTLPGDGTWTLITHPNACVTGCAELIDTLDRLDRAMGRHAEEVSEVVLQRASAFSPTGAVTAIEPSDSWAAFFSQGSWTTTAGAVLIDPLGNAMMTYPADFDASRLKKDLDRLLKYSKFNAS